MVRCAWMSIKEFLFGFYQYENEIDGNGYGL